jgi:hypothetical protein
LAQLSFAALAVDSEIKAATLQGFDARCFKTTSRKVKN